MLLCCVLLAVYENGYLGGHINNLAPAVALRKGCRNLSLKGSKSNGTYLLYNLWLIV